MKIKTLLSITLSLTLILTGLEIFPSSRAPTLDKSSQISASIIDESKQNTGPETETKISEEEELFMNLLELTIDEEHDLLKGAELIDTQGKNSMEDNKIIELYRAKIMSRSLNFDTALDLLNRLDNDKLPLLKAAVLIAKNDRETAEQHLRNIIEDHLDPYITSVALSLLTLYDQYDTHRDADISYLWTLFAQKLGNIGETEISLYLSKKALETAPEYRDAWLIKGYNEYVLKQYENAEKSLLTAYQLDLGNAQIQYLLGMVYSSLDQPDLSTKYLLYAEQNNAPYQEEISLQLGENALIQEDFSLANHYFQKTLEIKPKNMKALTQLIWINGEKLGQALQALDYAQTLSEYYPDSRRSKTLLIWAQSKIRSLEDSELSPQENTE